MHNLVSTIKQLNEASKQLNILRINANKLTNLVLCITALGKIFIV